MITQEYLKELLNYNPDNGVFTWLERPERYFKTVRAGRTWNSRYAGKVAGSDSANGRTVYRHIGIDGVLHQAHRLAWLYVFGESPADQIDHIDGDGSNNRTSNLRVVSNQENQKNQRLKSSNTSGVVGVSFLKQTGKWMARIRIDGKNKHLGYFVDIEDAAAARKAASTEYEFHENHGRS